MNPGWGAYAIVFVVSATVSATVVPLVRKLAWNIGAVVKPDVRHVHEAPTPTLGGAGLLAGFAAGMGVAALLGGFDDVFETASEPLGILVAASLIWAVGFYDDVRDISAPAKIAGIVLAGSVLSFAGVGLFILRIPWLDVLVLSSDWSALLTVVWVLVLTNAINLIDGLDGLAAGNPGALIAIATVGACVGFLPYNMHPASIFMGDGGALLLGLLLAASTMSVGGRSTQEFTGQTYFFFAPVFIPLFILAVPLFDTVFAIIRRSTSKASLTTADKGHLHHRLMNMGLGQRRSVAILWLWTALMSAFVLYPTYTGEGQLLALIAIAGLVLLLYTMFHPVARRMRSRLHQQGHPELLLPDAADEVADT